MTTEERIEALERKLTRTRRLLVAAMVAGLGLICMGQVNDKVPDMITAKGFRVIDNKGRTIVKIGGVDEKFKQLGPMASVDIYGPDGRTKCSMSIAGIIVDDGDHQICIGNLGGGISFVTRKGMQMTANWSVDREVGPRIYLKGDGGKRVAIVSEGIIFDDGEGKLQKLP